MIQALQTIGFRNLRDARHRFEHGWMLLAGDNGAGKTSVIEALYLASTSKSFLTHRMAECAREQKGPFTVEVGINSPERGRHDLRLTWDQEPGIERRVSGSRTDLLEYLDLQPVVVYSVREKDLLDGEPAARRRFLDSALVNEDPRSLQLLARLRGVLDSKRAALAGGGPVEPWNELLAPLMIELQQRRSDLITDLQERTRELIAAFGLGERRAEIEYLPSLPGGRIAASDGAEGLRIALDRRLTEERDCAYPLWGPQRDDWRWRWCDTDVKRRGSRGEKKALTLALLVAECQRLLERRPGAALLADDLDSDLDPARLRAVSELLLELPQVVATSSRPGVWNAAPTEPTHRVADGRLTRL